MQNMHWQAKPFQALALSLTLSLALTGAVCLAATPAHSPVKKPTPATKAKPAQPSASVSKPGADKVYSGNTSKTVQSFPIVKKIDLLRDVPLEISGYANEVTFPPSFTTADQVVEILSTKRNLLLHMEAIRRSYKDLPQEEQDKLLTMLLERYQTMSDDPVQYFDHGYAQLVLLNNKTGLFFLRKANDNIRDQFSSLAYAAAEVEADQNFEDAKPDQMTTRKLDAIFRFKDAVKRDADKHKPGFWPSYVRLVEKTKSLPAFNEFAMTDVSVPYVPYGNTALPTTPMTPDQSGATSVVTSPSCPATANYRPAPGETLFHERPVDVLGTGQPLKYQVFKTTRPDGDMEAYKVILSTPRYEVAEFTSPVAPYIIEDLDGDNRFEMVVRQYAYDPLNPVKVYRYDGCKFELDKKVEASFK